MFDAAPHYRSRQERPAIGMRPLRLGYCGKLVEEQKRISDLATLCESLELLNVDYQLRIAGDGDGAQFLSERLKRQIADGRVILLGWKSQGQLNHRILSSNRRIDHHFRLGDRADGRLGSDDAWRFGQSPANTGAFDGKASFANEKMPDFSGRPS